MALDRLASILFVPGIRPAMFDKAKSTPADAICLDLEDSVAEADKSKAREIVGSAIESLATSVSALLVRVNASDSGRLEEDLAAVVRSGLAGISLPKADDRNDVARVDHYLTLLERTRGIPIGEIAILPWIESACAVQHCETIVSASPRVKAASFGAEDFTASMGIPRSRDSAQLLDSRAQVVRACRAAGVVPLDTPDPDYRDIEWLAEDSRRSRDLGFEGRFCIHPSQVPIVNEAYRPTEAELQRARVIVAAYDDAVASGLGAIGLNGSMIDLPIVERARKLLKKFNDRA